MAAFLDSMYSLVLSLPLTLAAFVFVLGVVIAVHEAGHLFTGRAFGIKAEIYSLGFGTCLWARTDRKGTEWRICLIPLGGYVKFAGDKNAASQSSHEALAEMSEAERKVTFFHAPLIARACTIAAGPLTNLILAVLAFGAVAFVQGQPTLSGQVGSITQGTPAEKAGIKPGDIVTAVNGAPTPAAEDIIAAVERSRDTPMMMTIRRGTETLDLSVTAVLKSRPISEGTAHETYPVVGFGFSTAPENIFYVPMGLADAVTNGFKVTYKVAEITAVTIKRMITGEEGIENLSGPVRLAAISGTYAEDHGIEGLILLIGFVSVSIGFMNLLPIPVLDGGHLTMFAYEAVARKRPNKKVEQFSYGVGLAFVMSLMIFATLNDVAQLLFK
ncbi:M50 family metallopeptidase [Microvirga calopogonii]|uniref:M50 family metallopeptidase n=1 Tax=Microvirga calopogonii TaxID=2078013 RepID=UPI000E0D6321|nr:M50 family metallopeptidase [Microvirga calopogonii]